MRDEKNLCVGSLREESRRMKRRNQSRKEKVIFGIHEKNIDRRKR